MDRQNIKYAQVVVQLIRPPSIFYVSLWYLIGCLIAANGLPNDYVFITTLIGLGFSYASGNVLNDYFDKDLDADAQKIDPYKQKIFHLRMLY